MVKKKENYVKIWANNIEVDILLTEEKDFEEEPVKDEEAAKYYKRSHKDPEKL